MGLETATYIGELVTSNPVGSTDAKSQGDDHLRLIKSTLQATFPGMAGAAWRVQAKGAGYTVVANDNMTVIRCTAALTLSLTAAATLGNKHMFFVLADGGDVTIDPNSSETINGGATLVVPQGSWAHVFCNGTGFYAAVVRALLDEDNFASNAADQPASQQSIRAFLMATVGPTMPIGGLVPNLDVDTAHDINISAGACFDSTGAEIMTLGSAITKRIDASWVVGDAQGGLDGSETVAGTPDANTWYYVHLIKRSDTGVVDALFSESPTAPTLPTNYDYSRLIGAVLTDGSANIIGFSAAEISGGGVRFTYDAAQVDQTGAIGTSASLITISAPVNARMFGVAHCTKTSSASVAVRLSEESQTDVAPSGAEALYFGTGIATDQPLGSSQIELFVGANQRIRARASVASVTLQIKTEGFIMERR